MGSYIGAIATAVLGIIAVNQSRKYKILSDKALLDTSKTQNEIKYLNKKTTDAIETLMRIEKVKYSPEIHNEGITIYGNYSSILNEYVKLKYPFQMNYIALSHNESMNVSIAKLAKKYNTYNFIIRNEGEKTIRNFICRSLHIV